MRTPDVHSRFAARIFIERCHAHNDVRLCEALGHEMRATNRTEMSELSGRRLEGRQFLFTFEPTKVLPHNTGVRRKGGSMRLTASAAMAMTDWHIQLIDFVLNGTTQATALHIFTLGKYRTS
jgi:hypothetical protein